MLLAIFQRELAIPYDMLQVICHGVASEGKTTPSTDKGQRECIQ